MTTAADLRARAINNPDQDYRGGTVRHAFAGRLAECVVRTDWGTDRIISTNYYLGAGRVSAAKLNEYLAANKL